jgi:hypothetical protein
MERKNLKALMICLAIFLTLYVIRNMVLNQMRLQQQIAFMRAQQMRAAKPAPKPVVPAKPIPLKPAPRVIPIPPAQPKPKPLPPVVKYDGLWGGQVALDGRGVCFLRMELKEDDGKYTGFPAMTCNGVGPLLPRVNQRTRALNQMDPESAILSGRLERGTIDLHLDKTIGSDSNGCSLNSLSLTPFGSAQLAAEWTEPEPCQGGHMLMRRLRR